MSLQLIAPPSAEPVSLPDMKLYLRIDGTTYDTLLTALLGAARDYAQRRQRRAYLTQTWELTLDAFPPMPIELPYSPLATVSSIKYVDSAGAETTVSSSNYVVDTSSTPGRVALKSDYSWPGVTLREVGGFKLRYTCGASTAALVPDTTLLAIKGFVAHRFENPEDASVPEWINILLDLHKVVTL